MLKGNVMILKHLKYLAAKAYLGVHHILLDRDNREALLTRNARDDLFGIVIVGMRNYHRSRILGLVGVFDIYRNTRKSYGEDSILVKNCRAHVRKLTKLSVRNGIDRRRIIDYSRVRHHESRNVGPVLIKISLSRACHDRARDIRAAS